MQHLRAVGVEDGAILAASEDGTQFRVELDEEIRARLRSAVSAPGVGRKSNPREIQTYIRGGMSADQVAQYTGAPLEYVQRFEGPILAERQYMVEMAMTVPVLHPGAGTIDGSSTFGLAMEERLHSLAAHTVRWSSWKEPEDGWVLKVTFAVDGIDHDARWSFEPKRQQLAPLNSEAVALSQQGDIGAALMPRLRAVTADAPPAAPPGDPAGDPARFDSSAFRLPSEEDAPWFPEPVVREPAPTTGRIRVAQPRTGSIGVLRSEDHSVKESGGTADLLEALRRRRGERESATNDEEPRRPSTGTIRTIERVTADHPSAVATTEVPRGQKAAPAAPPTGPVPVKGGRRGRTSMPSWDEIVFGARPEDDPA